MPALALPCAAAGLPCSDSPCPQSPCEGGTLWGASISSGSQELCWHSTEEAAALRSQKPHTTMSLDTRETLNKEL